eukprot:Plantae.Rhodophyta-Purpureofilum_apyrenoidigerum.ctg22511.p1 GENE.Plantae.Rhodophyta-Purpureofilum_apyrenoidigerum.ctg22511~~Plantae.Rhodophyta-Purpureofilum_apyrenoidigerum.ctg22511.p1  ORF type:complete len:331 (-),score=98.49 Plantae.Rhodophyta-Purpureofilum_apyrenoidigerum.ctg22511:192-1184(-)
MYDEGWCTIESDPGVFTELLREVGVKDVQVEELFSLGIDSLRALGDVFGIIFLFKWKVPDTEKDMMDVEASAEIDRPPIFFANQVINNACATQAILSIVLNSPGLDIGEELREFKNATVDFDPVMKGLAISNLEKVRSAHNSFAPSQQFVVEEKSAEKDDDVYHFVSYIPWDGHVYELDGTKPGPIERGATNDNWLEACIPIIRNRMDEYSSSEIRFNLMAVVRNRENLYSQKLKDLREKLSKANEGDSVDNDEVFRLTTAIAEVEMELAEESFKQQRWKKENTRRKHNYVPFVMEFLKLLASKGELNKMIDAAKKQRRKRLMQQSQQQQ